MSISKTRIRKLGEEIRASQYTIGPEIISELEAYRVSFKSAIADTYNLLYRLSVDVFQNAIVAYRIKRIESIISKLKRIPGMKFDRMWDIAGCRCILNSNKQLYRLKDEIVREFEVVKINDYLEKPQKDGYRSLHLYVRSPNASSIVEIQLRNKVDHNWATLVEITDLLFDESLKNKTSESKLRELHLLFSNRKNLHISGKRRIIVLIRKYKFLEKLSEVFARNYIKIRKQWANLQDLPDNSFILIEASKDTVPRIDVFPSFDEAENEYFSRFSEESISNRVLTHIPHPTYKKLSVAYSNYILTYHQFIDDCFNMLESLILFSIAKNKIRKFRFYYNYYLYITARHIKNVQTEIDVYQSGRDMTSRGNKEWYGDITSELSKRRKQNESILGKMERVMPESNISRFILNKIFISARKRYDKLMKNGT